MWNTKQVVKPAICPTKLFSHFIIVAQYLNDRHPLMVPVKDNKLQKSTCELAPVGIWGVTYNPVVFNMWSVDQQQ